MSTRGVVIQIWDGSGALGATDALEADTLGLTKSALETALTAARTSVGRALRGESFTLPLSLDERPFELRLRPLIGSTGEPTGAASVLVDVSDHDQLREVLGQRVAFERLVTNISSQLVALPTSEIDTGIHHALGQIGAYAQMDRAYIFRFSSDGTTMRNTHEWCAEGIEPQIRHLAALPVEVFAWWAGQLRQRRTIHVPRVLDMPDEAASERQILIDQDVQSILVVPMVHEQTTVGFLGFDAVRAEKTWPESDIMLLRLVGEMFVGALERKRMMELEAQLLQARNLENVARLAGGVAHDFNNLLSVVLNCAAILRRNPNQTEFLDEIYDAAKRAADLTRQLLQVGRRGDTEPVVLDVNAAVRGLDRLLARTLGEHVEIRTDLAENIDLVRIGLPQLEQVIVNLAINARDAMPRGGTFSVRTQNVEIDALHAARFFDVMPGPHVLLSVSDTGVGMSPEVVSRAFEPFFTTKDMEGTGLGLSTVYGIVKQGGGHVILTSELGKGTTADVYLPVQGDAVVTEPAQERAGPAPHGRGETVLVVEDSVSLRALIRNMLTKHRYRVFDAATPAEALRLCERHAGSIDLLLTDVILPQMSGRALAKTAHDRFGVTRVLYMSGYDGNVVAEQGIPQEGPSLLQKPFVENDLLREVHRALERE